MAVKKAKVKRKKVEKAMDNVEGKFNAPALPDASVMSEVMKVEVPKAELDLPTVETPEGDLQRAEVEVPLPETAKLKEGEKLPVKKAKVKRKKK